MVPNWVGPFGSQRPKSEFSRKGRIQMPRRRDGIRYLMTFLARDGLSQCPVIEMRLMPAHADIRGLAGTVDAFGGCRVLFATMTTIAFCAHFNVAIYVGIFCKIDFSAGQDRIGMTTIAIGFLHVRRRRRKSMAAIALNLFSVDLRPNR